MKENDEKRESTGSDEMFQIIDGKKTDEKIFEEEMTETDDKEFLNIFREMNPEKAKEIDEFRKKIEEEYKKTLAERNKDK